MRFAGEWKAKTIVPTQLHFGHLVLFSVVFLFDRRAHQQNLLMSSLWSF